MAINKIYVFIDYVVDAWPNSTLLWKMGTSSKWIQIIAFTILG